MSISEIFSNVDQYTLWVILTSWLLTSALELMALFIGRIQYFELLSNFWMRQYVGEKLVFCLIKILVR